MLFIVVLDLLIAHGELIRVTSVNMAKVVNINKTNKYYSVSIFNTEMTQLSCLSFACFRIPKTRTLLYCIINDIGILTKKCVVHAGGELLQWNLSESDKYLPFNMCKRFHTTTK